MTTVLYNQGAQTIYFAPHDRQGVPSVVTSPQYEIVDLRHNPSHANRTVVALTTSTIASISTTLSASAGVGRTDPSALAVADASAFELGRSYLVGARESFVLDRKSGNTLYSKAPLRYTHASGAVVRAYEMQAAFPSDAAADEDELATDGGPYRINWIYTIRGERWITPQDVWLVRYSIAPLVSTEDLAMADPNVSTRWRGPELERAVILAGQDYVAELEAAGLDPHYFRTHTLAKLAQRHKALEYLYRWSGKDSDALTGDRHLEQFRRLVGTITTGQPPPRTVVTSAASDDQATALYNHGLWRRS